MTDVKRKTHTSTQVKQKYNQKVYKVISFSAPKELAAEFKNVCAENGLYQAQIFKEAMRQTVEKYTQK